MYLSPIVFDREFEHFKALMLKASKGQAFTTFAEGLANTEEGYKEGVRQEAIRRLDMPSWTAAQIGTGKILNRVINAIEINEHPTQLRNNLVAWQNRYGHNGRSHRKLLDAKTNMQAIRQFEEWFLDFAHGSSPEGDLFDSFRSLNGKRYDLIAYLFFIKDWTRFMPIAPATFDKVFRLLEIPLKTDMRCSWDNYSDYNDALRAVQQQLIERAGLSDTRLIDAHSFCWMLIRPPKPLLKPVPPQV